MPCCVNFFLIWTPGAIWRGSASSVGRPSSVNPHPVPFVFATEISVFFLIRFTFVNLFHETVTAFKKADDWIKENFLKGDLPDSQENDSIAKVIFKKLKESRGLLQKVRN